MALFLHITTEIYSWVVRSKKHERIPHADFTSVSQKAWSFFVVGFHRRRKIKHFLIKYID